MPRARRRRGAAGARSRGWVSAAWLELRRECPLDPVEFPQPQIAKVQGLGPGLPSLLDPVLRLPQVLLHDG
jgi:hypothetical protein